MASFVLPKHTLWDYWERTHSHPCQKRGASVSEGAPGWVGGMGNPYFFFDFLDLAFFLGLDSAGASSSAAWAAARRATGTRKGEQLT